MSIFKHIIEHVKKALGENEGFSGGSGKTFALSKEYEPAQMKKGGKVKSASARADGIAIRGKTRAR